MRVTIVSHMARDARDPRRLHSLSSWLTLAHAPGLHAARLRPLLERFGSADSILAESGARSAHWLHSRRQQHDPAIEAELRWLERDAHHFVPLDAAAIRRCSPS